MTSLNENTSQRLVDDDRDTAPVIGGWCGCSAQWQCHRQRQRQRQPLGWMGRGGRFVAEE